MPGIRTIVKRIRPPEVAGIASEFRAAASRVNDLVGQLERNVNELQPTWEGNSKNKFFGEYSPTPAQLRSIADTLNHLASEIENITVEVVIEERF